MAIAFVTGAAVNSQSNSNPTNTTGAIDTTGANFLVATITSSAGSSGFTSFTDSKGNTWSTAVDWTANGGDFIRIMYAVPTSVGTAYTVTLSYAGSASSGFSGPRAMGGPVTAGRSYVVGEHGPELFLAHHSGNIVPNHKLGGAPVTVAPVYNYTGNLSREEMAVAFERNNRQLVQMIQRAQSQSGQSVMVF